MYTRSCRLILVVSLLGTMLAQNARPNARLYGKVRDESGSVIPFAVVLVHPDRMTVGKPPDFSADVRLKVNEKGEFSTQLDPGLYDVMVFASIFSPQCAKVRVTEEAGQRDFTLHVERELTKTEN